MFVMDDIAGYPDCNTTMMIDRHGHLWLFWPTVINNQWDTVITNAQRSTNYEGDGAPKWDFHRNVLLRPAPFKEEFLNYLDNKLPDISRVSAKSRGFLQKARDEVDNKLYQSISWQPRCKPIQLPSGRILFGLYSDTYSFSLCAISDDDGRTWYASGPMMGYGPVQPALVRRDDGTVVSYMRQNGYGGRRIQYSESHDDGLTWSEATDGPLPNPGGGVDVVRLANSHWVMIYNDSERGRVNMAAALSEDEGRTWSHKRYLDPESAEKGSYAYPCVIQGKDGTIHSVYTYNMGQQGECMKHAAFNEEWIKAGEAIN
jgi:predicted neuraminidase